MENLLFIKERFDEFPPHDPTMMSKESSHLSQNYQISLSVSLLFKEAQFWNRFNPLSSSNTFPNDNGRYIIWQICRVMAVLRLQRSDIFLNWRSNHKRHQSNHRHQYNHHHHQYNHHHCQPHPDVLSLFWLSAPQMPATSLIRSELTPHQIITKTSPNHHQ